MSKVDFNQQEQDVLAFWRENNIFKKSVEKNEGKEPFVFYEGPPTANGRPGIHHFLARALKDIIPRYKTMRGYYVKRKAGWDTHGLPVELEVEKNLGINSKPEIEKYGIDKFNKKARESVWQYKEEWERFTERVGFWLDFSDPYITYAPEYVESLWWIIKQFEEKGFLYQDFRVAPYCPRCGTTLSSHEVAQGYETVTDNSVFIKFKLKDGQKLQDEDLPENTYLLSWTTTPWTLPGNVALAVNPQENYIKIDIVESESENYQEGESYILMDGEPKQRLFGALLPLPNNPEKFEADVPDGGKVIVTKEEGSLRGRHLVGLKYYPLFDIPEIQNEASHQVYPADFVSTEEGTGIVHTAVMYGEDDFHLGSEVGLPKKHTVNEKGEFNELLENYKLDGKQVKQDDTEKQIFDHLENNSLLLRQEEYEHEYPHCWRCDNPLLYYALDSWFVKTTDVQEEVIQNNQQINWIPAHVRDGRFGQFLEDLKDWAFSRSRYWGTPLPIWQCENGHWQVVGSLQELDDNAYHQNNFTILRHGEAKSNAGNVVASTLENDTYELTENGKKEVQEVGRELNEQGVDVIFASPFKRTQQTAEMISEVTGAEVHIDDRIKEIATGEFEGRQIDAYHAFFEDEMDRFDKAPEGGESLIDIKKRVLEFLREVNGNHQDANILIVAHKDVLWMMDAVSEGLPNESALRLSHLRTGEYRELVFHNWPRDDEGEIDMHRPYADQVYLKCSECGEKMQRVEEVADVWFDSGSMPFAQYHYPFENKELQEQQYPANFIAEGIDQTRGWFYTMHAISTLLGVGPAYKNVISHGLVLDADGKKMSKSKGNVVDPWSQVEQYGADGVRWFFYVVNQPGENKLYDERELKAHLSQFHMTLWNSLTFWQLAADQHENRGFKENAPATDHILDNWLASRLNTVTEKATEKLDNFDITGAGRDLEVLVDDLSNWYIRRSRGRLRQEASAWQFLGASLLRIAKLIAPFTPFLAENLFLAFKEYNSELSESVHLMDWPEAQEGKVNKKLEQRMQTVRELASKALEQRAQAGIKVRQPLGELRIKNKELSESPELLEVLKEEVNVKDVKVDESLDSELALDAEITEALKQEGWLRDLVRQINSTRQKAGLDPADKVELWLQNTDNIRQLVESFEQDLKTGAGLQSIELTDSPQGTHAGSFKTEDQEIQFAITQA